MSMAVDDDVEYGRNGLVIKIEQNAYSYCQRVSWYIENIPACCLISEGKLSQVHRHSSWIWLNNVQSVIAEVAVSEDSIKG
jgi:hypothetical protein